MVLIILIALLQLFALAPTSLASSGAYQPGSPWPHYRGLYNNNTGQSSYFAPQSSILKWSYATTGAIISSPSINAAGDIVFGSGDKYLYSVSSAGTLKWKILTGNSTAKNFNGIVASPAIGTDGTVYVGASDGNMYAVSSLGSVKWKVLSGGAVSSSVSIGSTGNIYYGSQGGYIIACSGLGTLLWYYTTSSSITYSSPAFSPDKTVHYI
jgi:outer membrane protein assembly factor BamB